MTSDSPADNWLQPSAALQTATNSFIVIIRSLPISGDRSLEWHGSVEHAQSRERIYFIDYLRLTDFIAVRCQTPRQQPWHQRLSRRWQKTALHHWLHPLKSAEQVAPLAGAVL